MGCGSERMRERRKIRVAREWKGGGIEGLPCMVCITFYIN
jgi:hypothetical protein